MIRVKAGFVTYHNGRKRVVVKPADGPVSLSPALEERFVNQGVAEYVGAAKDEPEDAPEPEQDATEPEDEEPEDAGYDDLTIKELREEWKSRGMKPLSRATKDDLIKGLLEDDEAMGFNALEAE